MSTFKLVNFATPLSMARDIATKTYTRPNYDPCLQFLFIKRQQATASKQSNTSDHGTYDEHNRRHMPARCLQCWFPELFFIAVATQMTHELVRNSKSKLIYLLYTVQCHLIHRDRSFGIYNLNIKQADFNWQKIRHQFTMYQTENQLRATFNNWEHKRAGFERCLPTFLKGSSFILLSIRIYFGLVSSNIAQATSSLDREPSIITKQVKPS